MRIAYLVNQYPMVSHVFIRREILALERRGIPITRISLRGWDSELVDDEDYLERQRTRYVLREGMPLILLAFVRMLLTRPIRLGRAFALTWRTGSRAERPLRVHMAYLAEACRIEPWVRLHPSSMFTYISAPIPLRWRCSYRYWAARLELYRPRTQRV